MRIKTLNLIVIFFFLLLFLSLLKLQVMQGAKLRELSNKNCIRLLPQEGARGRILDRNGEIIVDNCLTYDVMVLPQENSELEKIFISVAGILDKEPKDLKKAFKNNYLSASLPVAIAKNIEAKKAMVLEESKMDSPGIVIQPHPMRYYPYGKLACHVIGYLSEIDRWRLTKLVDYGYKTRDIMGYSGVEEKYDFYLRQEDGALSVEVDHRGRFIGILGFKPPQNGKDIQLTLDLKVQKIVEDNLGERTGSIVVMDPYSGEIIAMASSPGFNPAVFIKRADPAVGNLFRDPDSPLLNRAINGVYPPASVFKLVVAASALENKKINLGTTFFCSGGMYVGRRKFNCWDTHGQQDLLGGIARSCDVFFYHTGLSAGPQAIHDYALKFGFGRPSGVDLPYEAAGFVPDPLWKRIQRLQNWYDGDTANFSIGQGDLLTTPLQIARMTSAFASQGFLVRPYIVKSIDGIDICDYQKKISRLNLKERTIDAVRRGMRRVVSDPQGTANNLSTLPVAVAGKTGTSQVSQGLAHGWFAGFFPFEKPKFTICVFLEHGAAGYNASSLAKQIIEMLAKENLI